jgi:hypothetical protein
MTDDNLSFDFKKAELPHRLDPYQGAAAELSQADFAARFPDPFVLFQRSTLWDPLLVLARQENFGDRRTAIASFETEPGGSSFLSPIQKRQTDSKDPNIVLGRHKSNDLVVPISSVSARHCQFTPPSDDLPWSVADLGTKNGSFIDDVRMVPGQRYDLNDGGRLELSDVVTFFFGAAALWDVLRDEKKLEALIDSSAS